MDAWVVDPTGKEVWRRANIRVGDPFSIAVLGPRVRNLEHCCWSSLVQDTAEAL